MKATTNNVVAISRQRVAADVIAEASAQRARDAHEAALMQELLDLEREAARLADDATREGRVVKRVRTIWTVPLVALTGVAVWAAGGVVHRYEHPTNAVALAVSLALALAAATAWRAAPYPRLAWPTFVVVPLALLVAGTLTVATVNGPLVGGAWFVVAAALVSIRLRASWSAFALGRNTLRYQTTMAEVAVIKAAIAALNKDKE